MIERVCHNPDLPYEQPDFIDYAVLLREQLEDMGAPAEQILTNTAGAYLSKARIAHNSQIRRCHIENATICRIAASLTSPRASSQN